MNIDKIILDTKFDFGQVVATATLVRYCEKKNFSLLPYLIRHGNCDWGNLTWEDKEANETALKDGLRILSSYKLPDGNAIWIITEADRSATTILFPSDY